MDSLTHLLAGAATPLVFRNAPKSRLLIPFGIICGEFPDIDILAGSSAEAFLSIHRGITHALITQPFSALLLAFLFHGALKKKDAAGSWTFGKTWLLALLALLIHVYLDCMTTFGTQIFLPFSTFRAAVPGMFIVDPLFTIPLAGIVITLLVRGGSKTPPYRRMPLARTALAWVLVYPLLSFGVGQAAAAHLSGRYAAEKSALDVRRVHLTPQPFTPVVWKFVAVAGDERYIMGSFSILRPGDVAGVREFPRMDARLWADLQASVPLARMYADFASFPTGTFRAPAKGDPESERILVVRDLRYESTWGSLPGLSGDGSMFLFEVCLDPDNRPLAWRFLRQSGDRPVTPWRFPDGA